MNTLKKLWKKFWRWLPCFTVGEALVSLLVMALTEYAFAQLPAIFPDLRHTWVCWAMFAVVNVLLVLCIISSVITDINMAKRLKAHYRR